MQGQYQGYDPNQQYYDPASTQGYEYDYAQGGEGETGYNEYEQYGHEEQYEGVSGPANIRFTWSSWPKTKVEASRLVVPLACAVTPLAELDLVTYRMEYEPVRCKSQGCSAIFNPFCQVDYRSRLWSCPFCLTRNHLPSYYAEITPEAPPAELLESYATIDYTLPVAPLPPTTFLFVVDTATYPEELDVVRNSLLEVLDLLPPECPVGLITFGKHVSVHDLGTTLCSKSYVFCGNPNQAENRKINAEFVGDQIGLSEKNRNSSVPALFLPVQECRDNLSSILKDLTIDPWPVKGDERPLRASGTALSVGVSLLELLAKDCNARLVFLSAGVASLGVGLVVGPKLEETIRSHHEILQGKAEHYDKAVEFYNELATRVSEHGHVVDIFACCLDQVGLAEMRVLAERTGGLVILSDMFNAPMFKDSFKWIVTPEEDGVLKHSYHGEMEIFTSREVKVNGMVGHVTSLNVKGANVSAKEIGIGETRQWRLGGLNRDTTYSAFFEIESKEKSSSSDMACLQFATKYTHSNGVTYLRVTTVGVPLYDSTTSDGLAQIRYTFDQQTAAVVLARLAVHKAETEVAVDIMRWIDRLLIRLAAKFASYKENEPESFALSEEFSYFPQFIFHLRRSQFLQVVNTSPDETAFYRYILQRESVDHCIMMIQPNLMSYSMEAPAEPVLLDASSIHAQRILVLDTFFHVVLWYGADIAQWRDDNLAENPDYAHFKDMLQAAAADAKSYVESRFPVPIMIESDQDKSQSRFLVAKLNPSMTHNTGGYGTDGGPPPVFTDDVSLKVFMEHLRRLAVSQDK